MYLRWNQKTIADFSPRAIEESYNEGYVFTRIGKGVMDQTRSVRINLTHFDLSSENRRILKKVEGLRHEIAPLPYTDYSWQIGKMATDFYTIRGATFSANKIKELLTDIEKSNFTTLFIFKQNSVTSTPSTSVTSTAGTPEGDAVGYAICYETPDIIHYSYPFYTALTKDLGLGMMITSILWAKEHNKTYIYLGSLQRHSDSYKLQFSGIEWFDGKNWSTDTDEAKKHLKEL